MRNISNRLMKDFIILGTLNAVGYNNCFPLIKDDVLRMGYTKRGGDKISYLDRRGGVLTVCNSCWWTNQPSLVPPPLELTEEYSPEKYPKYDNYDAIECSRSRKIPKDYYGVIGVPISFIRIWNREQFELISLAEPKINGRATYERILIKRKK